MIKQPTRKLKIRILSETSIPYLIRHATVQCLNPTSHIFRGSAVEGALDLES